MPKEKYDQAYAVVAFEAYMNANPSSTRSCDQFHVVAIYRTAATAEKKRNELAKKNVGTKYSTSYWVQYVKLVKE